MCKACGSKKKSSSKSKKPRDVYRVYNESDDYKKAREKSKKKSSKQTGCKACQRR